MGKRILTLAMSLVVMMCCAACSQEESEPAVTAVVKAAMERSVTDSAETAAASAGPSEADPAAALEEIYENVDTLGLTDAEDDELAEEFYLSDDMYEECYIRYVEGIYGVADTFIVKPAEGQRDAVLEALNQCRLDLISENETMDVHNSAEIAKNALIYEQGGYVIMIAHEDDDAVKAIISQYIPQ